MYFSHIFLFFSIFYPFFPYLHIFKAVKFYRIQHILIVQWPLLSYLAWVVFSKNHLFILCSDEYETKHYYSIVEEELDPIKDVQALYHENDIKIGSKMNETTTTSSTPP